MKKILALSVLTVLAMSVVAGPSVKRAFIKQAPPAWTKLGERKVNMAGDHDEIPVTIKDGVFSKLKFKVLKAPIHVKNIKVVFGNGDTKNVDIKKKFAPGSESRVIDLPGNKRIIRKIVMNYKTVPTHKGKAVVVVWGRH